MTDDKKTQQLENRIDVLEATIEKMMPSRRDALKMGGAALAGGSLMAGTASAGTNQVGTIGSASQPVDLESEDINNADTVTTQDLVVNGTATGSFGADLQATRVFLSSDQTISGGTNKVQFDSTVYDTGNNFDTTNHSFTCPETGLYFANLQIRFDGGGDAQRRFIAIGTGSQVFPSAEGFFIDKKDSFSGDVITATTINKYAQGDTIAAHVKNNATSDILASGNGNSACFMEIGFLGSV